MKLEEVVGVEDADADHESGTVTVDGGDDEDVRMAIGDAGFTLEGRR